MNRIDRLLAIILLLERKGRQRAEDLSAAFEVTKRTIYRDIQSLMEMGVPIVSMTGYGYSLTDGYFLPPLRFTTDEAFTLVLGSDFVAQNLDVNYRLAAQAARHKIETIMPEALRHEIDDLQDSIGFLRASPEFNSLEMRYLPVLRRAIIEKRTVRLHYRKRRGHEPQNVVSEREVDPYGLKQQGEAWYMIGFCHRAREVRNFRLSRIQAVQLMSKTFIRPARFSVTLRKTFPEKCDLAIRVLFDNEAADRLPEARNFYIVGETSHPDGLLVTLKVRHERDVMPWLLGWGSHIRVLEPASMRHLLLEEAVKMQRHYE